jgi:hypothetical protein
MRALFTTAAILVAVALLASCAADPLLQVRRDFAGGRYELARGELSRLAESDTKNGHLWRLERSVTSLALAKPKEAIDDLRRARDILDDLQGNDYSGWFQSVLLDDTRLAYQGADFEIVLVRALLALSALMTGEANDAGAYALQVGAKQREIIDGFATREGRKPKEAYKLVAFGSYLRGILDEGALKFDVAQKSYERVRELEPSFAFNQENIGRITEGHISAKGNGVVHVLGLVGRGPFRVESDEPVTRDAFAIAQIMWAIFRDRATIPNIASVKIPRLAYYTDNPTELHVEVDGRAVGTTAVITDVEETARREFEAMKPHILARAVIRRAVKVVVTEGVKEAARSRDDREYRNENVLADLAISGAGLLWAALESADLRCWSLLPASFQVLRLELPEGEHDIVFRAGHRGNAFGPPQRIRVYVSDGYNTYVSVMTPTADGGPTPQSSQTVAPSPGS